MASTIDFTNYQTPMSMAINPQTVAEIVEEAIEKYSLWVEKTRNVIEQEKVSGGLSTEALDFGGVTPLKTSAATIERELSEITQMLEAAKESLVSEAEEQKKEELTTLKNAVDKHIEELKSELSSLNATYNAAENAEDRYNINISINRVNNNIEEWIAVSEQIAAELGRI